MLALGPMPEPHDINKHNQCVTSEDDAVHLYKISQSKIKAAKKFTSEQP